VYWKWKLKLEWPKSGEYWLRNLFVSNCPLRNNSLISSIISEYLYWKLQHNLNCILVVNDVVKADSIQFVVWKRWVEVQISEHDYGEHCHWNQYWTLGWPAFPNVIFRFHHLFNSNSRPKIALLGFRIFDHFLKIV